MLWHFIDHWAVDETMEHYRDEEAHLLTAVILNFGGLLDPLKLQVLTFWSSFGDSISKRAKDYKQIEEETTQQNKKRCMKRSSYSPTNKSNANPHWGTGTVCLVMIKNLYCKPNKWWSCSNHHLVSGEMGLDLSLDFKSALSSHLVTEPLTIYCIHCGV